jgi:hypothetical protein
MPGHRQGCFEAPPWWTDEERKQQLEQLLLPNSVDDYIWRSDIESTDENLCLMS